MLEWFLHVLEWWFAMHEAAKNLFDDVKFFTCQPCRRRLRSTALSHIIASPAWKSRNLWHRSRRKIPKHFNNSDVEACKEQREKEFLWLNFISKNRDFVLACGLHWNMFHNHDGKVLIFNTYIKFFSFMQFYLRENFQLEFFKIQKSSFKVSLSSSWIFISFQLCNHKKNVESKNANCKLQVDVDDNQRIALVSDGICAVKGKMYGTNFLAFESSAMWISNKFHEKHLRDLNYLKW